MFKTAQEYINMFIGYQESGGEYDPNNPASGTDESVLKAIRSLPEGEAALLLRVYGVYRDANWGYYSWYTANEYKNSPHC